MDNKDNTKTLLSPSGKEYHLVQEESYKSIIFPKSKGISVILSGALFAVGIVAFWNNLMSPIASFKSFFDKNDYSIIIGVLCSLGFLACILLYFTNDEFRIYNNKATRNVTVNNISIPTFTIKFEDTFTFYKDDYMNTPLIKVVGDNQKTFGLEFQSIEDRDWMFGNLEEITS